MSSSFDKFQKRRLISSYFSVVLSVFLVLFLLGMLGFFIINSKKLADDFKEEIAMTVFFKNDANDSILKAFGTELKTAAFAKSYVYVTKEAAAKQHTDIIGEDFMEFLGENPLQNSYDIHLKADYVIKDSITKIETHLRKNAMISDIVYDKQLVNLVNDNIKKVSMWILIISIFFTVIAVLLINSSLRLSIHSNRFIIKTMQMVGATKAFIRKPFVMRSVKLGMIGAGLAIIALIGVLIYVQTNFPDLGILDDKLLIVLVLLSVLGIGILITWVSTYFATQRFLNLRTDDLY
ncbi:permease-like cell division protein FtsX [Flavobacterium sp.]|uniref:cell division protein FtsX n=1 Tax=Flavobacterium sp. TaxID=239 RepID=UPI001B3F6475|nr:permease-like cell division protein FtsX [Flavobacterium sp.]MBP6181349.1 permease-like cell division protein FtsX [Flavobacterium sp.]